MKRLNSFIDHTVLKPGTKKEEISRLCEQAIKYSFASVCVPPSFLEHSFNLTKNTEVKVCTVIGFPNGYNSIETKIFEIKDALKKQAHEIDIVLNQSFVKDENWKMVEEEIKSFADNKENACLKIIIESGTLTDAEIKQICLIANKYSVDYVKTSTGFAKVGATHKAVEIMRSNLDLKIKIKASGGIRTKEDALKYIELGADRLGCSSSVEIVS